MSQAAQSKEPVESTSSNGAEDLLPLVYEDLRLLATRQMASEAPGQTLQPTALVHEAWLRLSQSRLQRWNSRGHFLAAAAETMRRILIDRARRRNRFRHGKGLARVDLDQVDLAIEAEDATLLDLDTALSRLAQEDPVKAELVKLRFFVGLSVPEAGRALGLSSTTAKRYWLYARAWLFAELDGDE